MKNTAKIITVILILTFAFMNSGMSQDSSHTEHEEVKINRTKRLTFEGESKKTEIKIVSTEDYNFLRFNIHVKLTIGEVKVEIIDPEGNKKGNFTVKSEEPVMVGNKTKVDNHVSGQMAKSFAKPMKGDWIIRAQPSSAHGDLNMSVLQAFEPRIDMIDVRNIK